MRYQDLRVAARVVAKNSIPTALSVFSIALGIGLTTAVFSVGNALVLRPLPLQRPGEVLTINSRGDDGAVFMYGWPDYEDMRHSGAGFLDIAAYQRRGGMLAKEEGSEMVLVSPATPNYFTLLGVRAVLGRASLEPSAGRPAAVLGWRLWQRRFGGDPEIVGKSIVFDGKALNVTGVLPAEFGGLERGVANDIWVSTDAWFDVLSRGDRNDRGDQFEIILRLRPGINADTVAARLDASIRGPGSASRRRSALAEPSSMRISLPAGRKTCSSAEDSSRYWHWSCSSPAPTSHSFGWPRARLARKKLRFVWRWEPAPAISSASCWWRRVWSPFPVLLSVCGWRTSCSGKQWSFLPWDRPSPIPAFASMRESSRSPSPRPCSQY